LLEYTSVSSLIVSSFIVEDNSKIPSPPQYKKIEPKVPNTKYLIEAETPPYVRLEDAKTYNVRLNPSKHTINSPKSVTSKRMKLKQATRNVSTGISGKISFKLVLVSKKECRATNTRIIKKLNVILKNTC
jgi:hypothetical protein